MIEQMVVDIVKDMGATGKRERQFEDAPTARMLYAPPFGGKMFENSGVTHAITLIHGTYAMDAKWTRFDSDVGRALIQCCGHRCHLSRFSWSGANNLFARIVATWELIAHLRLLEERWPGIRHILIAHSHGGNIAVQAASHGTNLQPIDGICCLATPFFHVRAKSEMPRRLIEAMIISILMLPMLIAIPLFQVPIAGAAAYALLACVIGLTLGTFAIRHRNILATAKMVALWSHAASPTPNLKILRTPGDEASFALSFGQMVAWVSRRALEQFTRPAPEWRWLPRLKARKMPRILKSAVILLFVAFLGSSIVELFWPLVGAVAVKMIVAATFTLLIAALIAKTTAFDGILAIFAAICQIIALMLNRFVVGLSISKEFRKGLNIRPRFGASWLLTLTLDIHTEPTPEGHWEITILPPMQIEHGEMSHSVYKHPLAIDQIVHWVGVTLFRCQD